MTDDNRPRRRGRPPLPEGERKSGSNLTFRARAGLSERLRGEAEKKNRSISEEIEWRIERSFEWERTLGSLQEVQDKIRNMSEDAAVQFLLEAGWPKTAGTKWGTVLSKPDSIANLGDGRVGRVRKATYPSFGFVADPADDLNREPAASKLLSQGQHTPSASAAMLPKDLEDAIYRAVLRAMRDARQDERSAGGETP